MAALHQLEFFLLRYTGDATKGESINLGVVAIAPATSGSGEFTDVRFIRNWRRLRCFDPLADVEEVQAIEREIRRDWQYPKRRADMLKRLADSWSNVIRFEQLQGCLTESPALEMERLNTIYLETPAGTEKHEIGGRQRILSVMRDELQRAGVLKLMQTNIAVSEYTRPGDPLKLDYGYSAAEGFKFLHAVSLAQRVDQATLVAARFSEIVSSMQTKKGVKAWLTAVVDDDLDRGQDEVGFALDMMQENGIVVAPVAKMPQIADGIRLAVRP
jgi:Protein of unknown function (DUF3037)